MNSANGYTNLNNAGRSGITLVEIVVSALILIASLTVLLITFNRVKHNWETARRELDALHVARTEIEQLHATTYSNIISYAATALTNTSLAPYDGKKRCAVVETNGYKEVTFVVSWVSTVGPRTISQTFNTIICSTN